MTIRTTIVLFALAAMALPLPAPASSSMWRVKVEQRGDAPCFTVESNADTDRYPSQLAYVSVVRAQSRPMARDGQMMWSLGLIQAVPTVQLTPKVCLVYGAAISGAVIRQPAQPLLLGVSYDVSFNSSLLKESDEDGRPYQGDFCLGKDTEGNTKVYDLHGDAMPPPGDACRSYTAS